MRFFKKYKARGFTLVELMIVVAIIGVLAALAIYGVRRYLASAKTSEAKNSLGAIARGAVGAFERETTAQEIVPMGETGENFSHDVCDDADPVPAAATSVAGRKYQADQENGQDYETGNASAGWKCLKFNMSSPQYYQYAYEGAARSSVLTKSDGASAEEPAGLAALPSVGFKAVAVGDLDSDTTYSGFAQVGAIDETTQSLRLATEISIVDEYE